MMHTITQIILLAMLDEQTMFKSACGNVSLDFFFVGLDNSLRFWTELLFALPFCSLLYILSLCRDQHTSLNKT
jgi:hypothetical protein